MIINPDTYQNVSDKEKNDALASHLAAIIEILHSEQTEFKEKHQISLYFNDALGAKRFKVKCAFQVVDFLKG
jgi:hypothetical protein